MACMQHSVLPCKFKSSACSHLRAAGVPSKSRAAMQMNAAAAARGPPSPSPSELIPPVFSRLSAPVYSLSTSSQPPTNSRATLNLVTYAAPVSIKPRRFVIGLYLGTLSHENFRETGHGVLQVWPPRNTSRSVLCHDHRSFPDVLALLTTCRCCASGMRLYLHCWVKPAAGM